jgi:6-phospho-beta-glucosidase
MKLTILGGGGVRMPGFVRSVLAGRPATFDEICLFEPDATRRATTGRLSVEIAGVFGQAGVVTLTDDAEQAFTGADYVFSAIRVGGDRGRVIDEQVALRRGIVGQETTGPGGGAMALRTIPVVLRYCDLLSRCAPDAVLINFTNPAGLITQAISAQGKVKAVGVCDTPSGTIAALAQYLHADPATVQASYGGLNHLGWITSFLVDGTERLPGLLAGFGEVAAAVKQFHPFDAEEVRRVGALPSEYVYYYYDSRRYVDGVAKAGTSRGQDVLALNEELLTAIGKAFADGDVHAAWTAYSTVLGVRRDTYMRTDTEGDNGQAAARASRAARGAVPMQAERIGGYEGLALRVIDGLSGASPGTVIVNVRNDGQLGFLDPDDIVEVPARVDPSGLAPAGRGADLPRSARALVESVKEYERGIVTAATTGDPDAAAVALAMNPLVPGIGAARELLGAYVDQHGQSLAYLAH